MDTILAKAKHPDTSCVPAAGYHRTAVTYAGAEVVGGEVVLALIVTLFHVSSTLTLLPLLLMTDMIIGYSILLQSYKTNQSTYTHSQATPSTYPIRLVRKPL